MDPVFRNVGKRSAAKNYRPVSLLSVLSKVFEKLVNNRIVDHLEKCGLFSDFQYGFRSSQSTANLLTVVSDKIARVFNRSGATPAVALDISRAFDRVWHASLLHKLISYGISDQIFGLIFSSLSNRRLHVVLHGSPLNLQWHSANAVIVSSMFFLTTAKFCHRDNFDIIVKATVTPTNIFTLTQALSRRHSCSLVMQFTLVMLQASCNGFK